MNTPRSLPLILHFLNSAFWYSMTFGVNRDTGYRLAFVLA